MSHRPNNDLASWEAIHVGGSCCLNDGLEIGIAWRFRSVN